MKARLFFGAFGLVTLGAACVWAADPIADSAADPTHEPTPPAEVATAGADDGLGHTGQFGLSVGLVGGYNMIFRYDKSPYCAATVAGQDPQKFCGHAAPLALDVALSFGVLDFIEPYLFGRFGLVRETQTDTRALQAIGAGSRVYTMSGSAFKIFIAPALAFEFEGGSGDPAFQRFSYKKDVLFHLAAGPQFDLAKAVGVFLDAGLTTGILRSIHSELEVEAGVQARLP